MFSSQATTQEIGDTQELLNSEDTCWGKLISTGNNSTVIELTDICHQFGRGPDIPKKQRFSADSYDEALIIAISKLHFRIKQIQKQAEKLIVLEDLSFNGTYVNKTLVGKKKQVVLKNNDEISLAHPDRKVFIFYDCENNDAEEFPLELREKYTVTKTLGTGSFGEVRMAYCQDTLQKCAVKILRKSYSIGNIDTLKNETEVLCKLDHPCVVKLHDLIESPDKIYMVMELANGGELFDRIVDNKRLSESLTKLYFYQLLHAIQYLHSERITHRDIKPENILLATPDEITCIKITDFGLSKLQAESSMMQTFCGTPTYIPPELLQNMSYTNKVDMWSLGVVLYVCLAGSFPFQGQDNILRSKILKADFNFKHNLFRELSDDVLHLISKLIVVNPGDRLSASEALKHAWFDDATMKETADKLMMPITEARPSKRPREEDDTNMKAKTPKIDSKLFDAGES